MIKIQSTIQPKSKVKWKPKNLTLGDMRSFWKREGNFNRELYERITDIKNG